jgi:uncharacterized protein YxjI
MWAKLLRLFVKKPLLPTVVHVYEHEAAPAVISLRKRPGFLHTTVIVIHATRGEIGRFKSKLFSLGGGFHVFDRSGKKVADVKGDWKGWNFKMLDEHGQELGVVTKKWAGFGKELFTTADNYMIALNDSADAKSDQAALLLAPDSRSTSSTRKRPSSERPGGPGPLRSPTRSAGAGGPRC